MAEGPLAVGHHRDELVAAVHPPQRPQFVEGHLVLPRRVGRLGGRLAGDRQASRPAPSRLRVGVGQLRIGADQFAGLEQMSADDLGALGAEAPQFGADGAREIAQVDVLGGVGLVGLAGQPRSRDVRLAVLVTTVGTRPAALAAPFVLAPEPAVVPPLETAVPAFAVPRGTATGAAVVATPVPEGTFAVAVAPLVRATVVPLALERAAARAAVVATAVPEGTLVVAVATLVGTTVVPLALERASASAIVVPITEGTLVVVAPLVGATVVAITLERTATRATVPTLERASAGAAIVAPLFPKERLSSPSRR
ncbi:hypothetical protein G7070_14350 [Propioniciclava coleopterorum]|uniref:Uncharacterized protein n=1 Tax=Propioniciclava coleopterorum TaxID=2714937 RepID=A0A6G7Y8V1_9ACTN|nr:hypothetical protein [Propioniciclava coleopterorum]QIK73223.1 hypothetical protein G7070_14350 [Propioniciclava coleopterorum]